MTPAAGPPAVLPAAVVFDLDGTLVLTEGHNRLVWATFLGRHGVAVDEALAVRLTGRRAADSVRELAGRLPDRPLAEHLAEIDAVDAEVPMDAAAVPGAVDLVGRLAAAGVPLGLVTSAGVPHATAMLASLGLGDAFAAVVTAEQVAHGKPDPEGYLLACRRLGVDPAVATGVEDAPAGVAAVRAAGLRCVAVATTSPREGLQAADLVVDDLVGLDLSALVHAPG